MVEERKVVTEKIEGQELDMDVEPTTEEIEAAEKMAEEEPEG